MSENGFVALASKIINAAVLLDSTSIFNEVLQLDKIVDKFSQADGATVLSDVTTRDMICKGALKSPDQHKTDLEFYFIFYFLSPPPPPPCHFWPLHLMT